MSPWIICPTFSRRLILLMRSVMKASVLSSTRPALLASGQSSGWAVALAGISGGSAMAEEQRASATRPESEALWRCRRTAGRSPGNLHLDIGGFETLRQFGRRRRVGD